MVDFAELYRTLENKETLFGLSAFHATILYIIAGIADSVTTYIGIYKRDFVELNFILSEAMSTLGVVEGLIAVKGGGLITIFAISSVLSWTQFFRVFVLLVGSLLTFGATINNVILLS